MSSLERISWTDVRHSLRSDRRRLHDVRSRIAPYRATGERWTSAYLCVVLYRISNYFYRANHRWTARVIWQLNVVLTGADISEPADLGPGLVVLHPPGTAIMCPAGKNLTVLAASGIGGEIGRREDIAGWPGVPLLGDDVVLGPHSGTLGPVTVGNRVRIRPCSVIIRNMPDDTVVESPRVKILNANAPSKLDEEL